jgi:hypothetical protein
MDTTAFIVTNVAWLLLAGVAAFRTLRYERRRQKLIVAVVRRSRRAGGSRSTGPTVPV